MSYSSHKHKSWKKGKKGKLTALKKNMLVVSVKMWCKNTFLMLKFALKICKS